MAPTSGALAHGTAYLALLGLLAVGFHRLEADHLRIDGLEADAALSFAAGPIDAEFHAKQRGFQDEVAHLRAENREIKARLQALVASLAMNASSTSAPGRRHLEEDLAGGEFVVQHFADVVPASGGLGTGGTGCANCGHRRAQSSSCVVTDLARRFDAINTACCNEPGEDCSGGAPATCSGDCAEVLLPFYEDCAGIMDASTLGLVADAAQGCTPGQGNRGSLVEQLNMACAEEGVTDCVPWCDASLHGDQLLLSLDGNDAKFTCELRNEVYSWVGPATDGGYIGADFQTFFSAVVSGAAGVYVGALLQDAGIRTDLTVKPGQTVSVSGDPSLARAPRWGAGGFAVQERASLTVTYVDLSGDLSVTGGGSASLSASTLGASFRVTVEDSGSLSLASMAVSAMVLGAAQVQLSGTGSTLRLVVVTVVEYPEWGALTGMETVGANGSKIVDSPTPWPAFFAVASGPCEVTHGGRCVGRAGGYMPSEACDITVGGGGGVLEASCRVFDLCTFEGYREDYVTLPDVTLPDGFKYRGSNCPRGVVLPAGGAVGWVSDRYGQGSYGQDNHCDSPPGLGRCGLLPWVPSGVSSQGGSQTGLAGGWEICIAA